MSAANILVVDDDPAVLRVLDRTLRQRGYHTIPVGDPVRARQLLDVVPVDAIVADLNMSLDDGRCFAAAVRRDCPQPLVVVTGTTDFRAVVEMLGGLTPQGLLAKPILARELTELVETILRARPSAQADERRIVCELAQGMARALAVRDVETHAHAQRVALWTRRVATEIGMDDDARFWAQIGALLHDIGKIGVPDRILHKPGSLAPDEWAIMQTHATLGGELLDPIKRLARARDVVVHHHEAWNGAGYPNHLAGTAIPIAARLFSPVDAYDAMTSDRPYRRGMSHDEAMSRIVQGRGAQFDPDVVDAIQRIGTDEWLAVRDAVERGASVCCSEARGDVS